MFRVRDQIFFLPQWWCDLPFLDPSTHDGFNVQETPLQCIAESTHIHCPSHEKHHGTAFLQALQECALERSPITNPTVFDLEHRKEHDELLILQILLFLLRACGES